MVELTTEVTRTIKLLEEEIERCEKDVENTVAHADYLEKLKAKLENGEDV